MFVISKTGCAFLLPKCVESKCKVLRLSQEEKIVVDATNEGVCCFLEYHHVLQKAQLQHELHRDGLDMVRHHFFDRLLARRPVFFEVFNCAYMLGDEITTQFLCEFTADCLEGMTPTEVREFFLQPCDMSHLEATKHAATWAWMSR